MSTLGERSMLIERSIAMEDYLLQVLASLKSFLVDFLYAAGQIEFLKAGAVLAGLTLDGLQSIREANTLEAGEVHESLSLDGLHATF